MARGSARQRRSAASGRSSTWSGSCARTRSRRRRGTCPCTSCPASACRGASLGTLQGQCGVFKPSAANTRARAPLAAAHDTLGCAAREGEGGRLRAIACTAHHTTARSATPCARAARREGRPPATGKPGLAKAGGMSYSPALASVCLRQRTVKCAATLCGRRSAQRDCARERRTSECVGHCQAMRCSGPGRVGGR